MSIDYGYGLTNIDTKTGIRYGVISINSLGDGFFNEQEFDYGDPTCPVCGRDATDAATVDDDDTWQQKQHVYGGRDYACTHCKLFLHSEDCWPDEPIGWTIDTDGYQAINCLDNDAMLVKSPYYTYAQFCSPCVPGAGDLDSALTDEDNATEKDFKAYCFGHDWFEGNKAPYIVYSVETDEEVQPQGESK